MPKRTSKAIYCLERSDYAAAAALQKELRTRLDEHVEIKELHATRTQTVPEELIILAHSDTPPKHIGDKTPAQLADDLAKEFKDRDKTALKSVKLVSCEGGFGPDPLAQQLVNALHKKGFTQVSVQAVTHPQNSTFGGVVSVITKAVRPGTTEGQVTAVMYGNQITADYERYSDLYTKSKAKPPNITPEEREELDSLKERHQNFNNFSTRSSSYQVLHLAQHMDDLDNDYNTYTPAGPKAQLSIGVAAALDVLKQKNTLFERTGDLKAEKETGQLIAHFQSHSNMAKNDIMRHIDARINEVSSLSSTKDLLKNIKNDIEQKITVFSNGLKKEIPQAIQQPEQDYLPKLLAKDSFFQKIVHSINGTNAFTKMLAQQLKMSNDTLSSYEQERDAIKQNIDSLKKEDTSKLFTSSTFGLSKTATPLKRLYDALDKYFIDNQESAKRDASFRIKEEYTATKDVSPNLIKQVNALEANHNKITKVLDNCDHIKKNINEYIQTYLDKHQMADDEVHLAKKAVMNAIKTYLNEPTPTHWNALQKSTVDNKGWDKGIFSQVSATMEKITSVHEELEQSQSQTARLN